MYTDLNQKKFDYVILGTSLTESIISSLLAKNGNKIIQFDINKFYGGDCKNMNFKEFNSFTANISKEAYFHNAEIIKPMINFAENEKIRDYNIDFNTKILFSKSLGTDELSNSKAAHYLEFTTIRQYSIYHNNKKINVPTNKSEIFMSDELELKEKQVLFNFLMAVNKIMPVEDDLNSIDDFKKNTEVDNQFINILVNQKSKNAEEFLKESFNEKLEFLIKFVLSNFSVGLEDSNKNYTIDDMLRKITKYLSSVNVYSKNPFLYPIYGSSEFSQALCRISSIYQGIFIINEAITIKLVKNNINNIDSKYFLYINDIEKKEEFVIETDTIIINESLINASSIIIEGLEFEEIKSNQVNKLLWYYVIKIDKEFEEVR